MSSITTPIPDISALRCSEEEWQAMKDRTDEVAPRILPPNWRERWIPAGDPLEGARAYENLNGLQVLLSCGLWSGRWWLHVSVTAPRRCPYWAELCEVKDWFVGRERQAIQVLPPRSKHINIHPYCLHLWSCLEPDGDGLPNFGKSGSI